MAGHQHEPRSKVQRTTIKVTFNDVYDTETGRVYPVHRANTSRVSTVIHSGVLYNCRPLSAKHYRPTANVEHENGLRYRFFRQSFTVKTHHSLIAIKKKKKKNYPEFTIRLFFIKK